MTFPTTLFHKDLAPEGQIFMTKDDLPDGKGWVDTPAAFDPKYVAPPPVEPDASLPEDVPAGFKKEPYPSHRYKINDPDNPKTVGTEEEDAALEDAEPGIWKHSPDPREWEPKAEQAKKPAKGAKAASAPSDAPPPPVEPVVLTDAQKAEFYAAKVQDLFEKLEAVGNVQQLEALAKAEAENPKPRVTVAKAIKARLAALKNASAE